MQVTSGAEWQVSSGNYRNYSVGFDSHDGENMIANWAELSIKDQLRELQKRADIMVLQYLNEEGAISDEMYRSRVSAVRAKK